MSRRSMEDSAREPAHLDLFRYLTADEREEYIAITSSLLADMSAATAAGTPLTADTAESRCKQLGRPPRTGSVHSPPKMTQG